MDYVHLDGAAAQACGCTRVTQRLSGNGCGLGE